MSPLVHGSAAYLLAGAAGLERRSRRLAFFAGLAGDLDAAGLFYSPQVYEATHHGWGHSVTFAVLVAGLFWAASRDLRARTALVLLAATFGHLLFDFFGSNWPMMLLWPFSTARWGSQALLSDGTVFYIINPVACALLLAAIFWYAIRAGRTPLEAIWPPLDSLMVGAFRGYFTLRCATEECPHRSFAVCASCGKPSCSIHTSLGKGLRPLCASCSSAERGFKISVRMALIVAAVFTALFAAGMSVILSRIWS